MKTFKYLAIASLFFITFNVSAQQTQQRDPLKTAQSHIDRLKKYITGITSDQESTMLGIERWFVSSAQDVFDANAGNSDAIISKLKQLSDERDTKMQTVLSTDQYAQYMKIYSEAEK
ncbi:MAG TPA: hypothetical protein VN922_22885 [Bacteroidia bacterium]|nr:hypothetical protein [Bacteroidia bacterium]